MKTYNWYMTDEQIEERVDRFKYIRDENYNPIGIVLIDKDGLYGWSLYNKNHEEEKASTDKGLLIALSRATTIGRLKKDIQDRVMKANEYRKSYHRLMSVLEAVSDLKKNFDFYKEREKDVQA